MKELAIVALTKKTQNPASEDLQELKNESAEVAATCGKSKSSER
jgi:hypothetical protein